MTPSADRSPLSLEDQKVLLDAASESIAARLFTETPRPVAPIPPNLLVPAATFVTLRRKGQLLGCIGSLEPSLPLIDDVRRNACAAAFDDPRLPSVTRRDFAALTIEVSVLSAITTLDIGSWEELRGLLLPELDGLLIEAGHHRATFLPSVWEQLPDADDFLDALWRKAGLSPRAWPDKITVGRYWTDKYTGDSVPPIS